MSNTKNKASDLNNLLFEQLERLNDATDENIKAEVERSKAISNIADKIISNGALILEAEKLKVEYRTDGNTIPNFKGLLEG